MIYVALTCRSLTGLVFLVSAFSKLRSGAAFREFTVWLAGIPVPVVGRAPRQLGAVLVMVEVAIVVLVALPWTVRAGLVLAAAALASFTAATWLAVAQGAHAPCQCFGKSASQLGRRHAVRDALLCAAALVGALGAGAGAGVRAAEVLASLGAGLAIALFVVFLDDLTAFLAWPGAAGSSLAPRTAHDRQR